MSGKAMSKWVVFSLLLTNFIHAEQLVNIPEAGVTAASVSKHRFKLSDFEGEWDFRGHTEGGVVGNNTTGYSEYVVGQFILDPKGQILVDLVDVSIYRGPVGTPVERYIFTKDDNITGTFQLIDPVTGYGRLRILEGERTYIIDVLASKKGNHVAQMRGLRRETIPEDSGVFVYVFEKEFQ